MTRILHRLIAIGLYACLFMSVFLGVWSLLRTDTYRQETDLILSQAAEIRWRVSQSKEYAVRISGYLELASKTGERNPALWQNVQLLRFNLNLLTQLSYVPSFVDARNMASLQQAILLLDTKIAPAAFAPEDYQTALQSIGIIDCNLARVNGATIDYSQALSATAHVAIDAAFNRLVFFGALSVLLMSTVAFAQFTRMSRTKEHIRSFSMLFAHMTRTRITALRLFLGYLDDKSLPPPEMTEAALHTILELNSITEALMTIGHARSETQLAPLGTLIDAIARTCKLRIIVEADSEARAVTVPTSQFHLVIDELLGNAINAVAAQTEPAISIKASVRPRLLRRAQLSSAPGRGTSVRITYLI